MKCERGKENALDTITASLIKSKGVVILYPTIRRREVPTLSQGISKSIYIIFTIFQCEFCRHTNAV